MFATSCISFLRFVSSIESTGTSLWRIFSTQCMDITRFTLHYSPCCRIFTSFPELCCLGSASLFYIIWAHSTLSIPKTNAASLTSLSPISLLQPTQTQRRPLSPRLAELREHRRSTPPIQTKKADFGFIWMSVPKNFRYFEFSSSCWGFNLSM
jgi:hypothetical protein